MEKKNGFHPVTNNNSEKSLNVSKLISLTTKKHKSLTEYINEVANELGQEQAFYVFDLADVLWKVQLWREKLPNVRIFYAVKCNPEPILLRFLAVLGQSFDCSTEGEIRQALKAGASPKNIVFAHTIKTHGGLKYAESVGVDLMTFDNDQELLKIHSIYPEARLVLRLRPKNSQCAYDLSEKYGCSVEKAFKLLAQAKEIQMNVVGMCFHVGSLCTDPKAYISTMQSCSKVFAVASEMGFNFTLLDIGGGYFGAKNTDNYFLKTADVINEGLKKYFPGNETMICGEPGCFIPGSAFTMVTTIFGKRTFPDETEDDENAEIERHYYLNEGSYGSFRDIEDYDIVMKPLLTESELKKRPVYKSKLFGVTCCSRDVIVNECYLPEMEIGERVIWENMGAYTLSVSSSFSAVPFSDVRYIFQDNSRLNLSDFSNMKEISNFLRETVIFIEEEQEKKI